MSRAYASMISIRNAGDYFEQKEKFDAVSSWKETIRKMAPECHQAFAEFAEANLKSPICHEPDQMINELLKTYDELYSAKKRETAAELLISTGKHIETNAETIREKLDARLLKDIQMWLEEYESWGGILKLTGEVLLADLSMYREDTSEENLDDVTAKNKLLEERLKKAVEFCTTVFGDELFTFALDRLRISKGLVTMYRY
jgi:hypothetical protein